MAEHAEAYKKGLPEAKTEKPIGASINHSESSLKRLQAFDEECGKKKAKNHAMMKESLTYPRVSVLGHPCNLTAASPVEMAHFAIEAEIIKAETLNRQTQEDNDCKNYENYLENNTEISICSSVV